WGQNMAFISVLVKAFGGQWFDQNWKPLLPSQAWKSALRYYIEVLQKYGPPNTSENGWQENQALFAQGHLGIFIDATSLAGEIFSSKAANIEQKVSYAPAPIVSSNHPSHWFWTWAMAIPESSKHQSA